MHLATASFFPGMGSKDMKTKKERELRWGCLFVRAYVPCGTFYPQSTFGPLGLPVLPFPKQLPGASGVEI